MRKEILISNVIIIDVWLTEKKKETKKRDKEERYKNNEKDEDKTEIDEKFSSRME